MSQARLLSNIPNLPTFVATGNLERDVTYLYVAVHELEDIIAKLLPFTSIKQDGLIWEHNGGNVAFGDTVTNIAPAQITLAANATSYVEITTAGAVSVNTTGFTAGNIPIAKLITNNTAVTQYTDMRALLRR